MIYEKDERRNTDWERKFIWFTPVYLYTIHTSNWNEDWRHRDDKFKKAWGEYVERRKVSLLNGQRFIYREIGSDWDWEQSRPPPPTAIKKPKD